MTHAPVVPQDAAELKGAVRAHWEAEPCGTRDLPVEDRRQFFAELERERYEWEPYIHDFARFEQGRGQQVLEIGVGAGSDFINWARNGANATGIDLTDHGVGLTRERLALEGLHADVRRGDAEQLPFAADAFDMVYSWGVLHCAPDTPRAVREVHRVLRPGGKARVMIYYTYSWVGLMLWLLHCLAKGLPWKGPGWAMYHFLKSPGTKGYTRNQARELFCRIFRSQCAHAFESRRPFTHASCCQISERLPSFAMEVVSPLAGSATRTPLRSEFAYRSSEIASAFLPRFPAKRARPLPVQGT